MGSRLEQKSSLVRKRIEGHNFDGEDGDEYAGSHFGGFSDYFRRKKIKLQNLDAELRSQSDKPQVFKGVVCHVNGYTQPSLNDLHVLVVQHGGGFVQYLDGKTMVTHIIASNLTPKKKEEFRRYRIVKPAWIVDSVKAGKLLPWDAYRVIDEGAGQKVLAFENGNVVSQANRRTQGYREQTDASWYTSQLRAQPHATQTITPDDDIEDDDYPLPEITSSIEEALNEADQMKLQRTKDQNNTAHMVEPEVVAKMQTPPRSSPPRAHVQAESIQAPTSYQPPNDDQSLRAREGSQEPDFSHAVVRESDVFKNVSPSKLAKMTAEEHNALLLSDPNIRKSTVVHPDFLEQYYRESRLHHLSTWKADLKSQLQAIAAEMSSTQKAQQKRIPGSRRYIMHVDFDSFFTAVSLKKHPQYKDKPAVVAHGNGSGSEIASCNYPARAFGISNGMWMKRAQQLCPDVKILPYDFPGYEAASRKFYDAIMATGGIVQSVSIDEALIEISAICFAESGTDGVKRNEGAVHREQAKVDEIAQRLRDEVLEKTGCAVSVGIGANILQAKVALRKAKPAGQYQLKPEDVVDFMAQLEVTKLPGVAYSIGGKLEEIGIKLVKDIREVTKERLISTLGPKTGEKIWEYARGIDKTEVGDQVVRKSVSAEVNWGVRFENQDQVDEFMRGLSGELSKRLLKERARGKQLTMKVMKRAADAPLDPPKHLGHGKCDVFNKSLRLGVATNDQAVLAKEATAMLKSFGISPGELRGIGVQMQQLEPLKQGAGGAELASQPKLQFSKPAPAPLVKEASNDPIQDDKPLPQKERIPIANQPSAAFRPVQPGTPTKKPLNVFGTQFILPTQVDPAVLAELPEDIRSKLTKAASKAQPQLQPRPKDSVRNGSDNSSRDHSPAIAFPPQSQIDPTILAALPEDVRNEILGFYKSPGNRTEKRSDPVLLPQSPRKLPKAAPHRQAPAKRGRGRPRGSRNLFPGVSRGNKLAGPSGLIQSNFVNRPAMRGAIVEEFDPEVLAALPEDLRKEVIAQQRQARGGLSLARPRPKGRPLDPRPPRPKQFTLPPRTPKPVFTSKQLTKLSALRKAVSAWFKEFYDEVPYEDDVDALIKYLRDVVTVEKNLDKAVAVVRWMGWVVDEGEEDIEEDIWESWKAALAKTQKGVQEAIEGRGLGKVDFG